MAHRTGNSEGGEWRVWMASNGATGNRWSSFPEALRETIVLLHFICSKLLQLSGPSPSSVWLELSTRAVLLLRSVLDEAPQGDTALAIYRSEVKSLNEQLSTFEFAACGYYADQPAANGNSSDFLAWPETMAACLETFADLQLRRG